MLLPVYFHVEVTCVKINLSGSSVQRFLMAEFAQGNQTVLTGAFWGSSGCRSEPPRGSALKGYLKDDRQVSLAGASAGYDSLRTRYSRVAINAESVFTQ